MDGDYRHIAFGSILGDDRKPFKTRSGDTVSLQDVLDEAIERAARVVEEKSPDMPDEEKKRVAEVVGIGAVKFAELSQNRMTDYVFNWDKMLALQGDTAPYLQNSYVRVRSIFRKLDGGPLDWSAPIQLSEDAEIHLARLLARYGEVVPQVLDDCRPNVLAAYLFDLARAFHSFYEACPVLKSEGTVRHSRLALCELTARTLKHGLVCWASSCRTGCNRFSRMDASFLHVLLAAAVVGCSSAAADGAHGYWMNSPSLNGWREAVFRAGVPAQPAVLPPGVEPMMVGSSSPAAQMLVLEGMTHLLTFGDMRAFLTGDAALRLDPDCLMAHWGRCMSLMGAGPAFQDQRVHSMKRMKELALRPDCPERERAYADALAVLLMDGPVKAREAWKTICSTWKRDPYAPLFYAMLLRDGFDGQGNPGEGQKEAVRVVEDVLKERPGSQAALFMRALLEEVAPSISPATVETARRAVSANPFSASAHHLLGHCLFRTGDYEGASAAFKESENLCLAWEKAENVSPALDDAYFRSILYRAVSGFCAGRYKRAEAIASKAASVPLDKSIRWLPEPSFNCGRPGRCLMRA